MNEIKAQGLLTEAKSPPSKSEVERALEKAYARAVGTRLAVTSDFHGLLCDMATGRREWVN
jgi:hypothetical protein